MWPHRDNRFYLEGWEFDSLEVPEEVLDHIGYSVLPAEVIPGSRRWVEWVLGRNAAVRAAVRAGLQPPLIDVTPRGAPQLRGSAWGLSIAHTQGIALAAVAPLSIGIDVERADRDTSTLVRVLADHERDLAESVGAIDVLVAKEAVAKATGLGLGGSLARWPVIDVDSMRDVARITVSTPDDRCLYAEVTAWGKYVVGVALIESASPMSAVART